MKKAIILSYVSFLILFLSLPKDLFAQNVGIGTPTPLGKLHIKGTANVSQLIIDANGTQSNINPLIKFCLSDGTDLMWIHSDNVNNTFIGLNTGRVNNVAGGGINNTFIGRDGGYSNTTGDNNTAIGLKALYSNTIGSNNTAIGLDALYSNSGYYNSANGMDALYSNISGNGNTASGFEALYSNSNGFSNTANGYAALYFNTTGGSNSAFGNNALYANDTGSDNTAVGDHAFHTGTAFSNSTALGYAANITASDQIRIGNTSVSSIGGQVGWTTLSDGRFKKDINEKIPGLDFIMKLHPVTYHLDMDELASFLKTPDSLRLKEGEDARSNMLQSGFIAQDVEKAAQEVGYDFSGVDRPKNENDYYGLRYAEFVVPLVKAVQELNDQLKTENQKLIERIEKLEAILGIKSNAN